VPTCAIRHSPKVFSRATITAGPTGNTWRSMKPHKLDRQLQRLLARFELAASKLRFRQICLLSQGQTIARQQYRGVYLIEIKTPGRDDSLAGWIKSFQAQWDHPRFARAFTNTTKQKRIRKHKRLREWMPLYIGRSQKVGHRVGEHIALPRKARTFAMKLRMRGTFFKRNQFRLRTIKIDTQHYHVWAPILERVLRDKHNPIVGRQ
jgi:hypothetical protein